MSRRPRDVGLDGDEFNDELMGGMGSLLLLGAGGHARVVADAALQSGMWEKIAFVDKKPGGEVDMLGFPVFGPAVTLDELLSAYDSCVPAVGANGRRIELLDDACRAGYKTPIVRHPGSMVSGFAAVGEGAVLMAGAILQAGCRIGRGSIVNTGATVDHDCIIGQGVHLCPGVNLAGNVEIGDQAWVGIGAAVREGVRIGAHAVVGAGAVVVTDVESSATVAGVPARPL